jgi:uncharacterized protein YggE
MNQRILLLIGLTTLPLLSAKAQWQQPPAQIDVSGSAEIKVAPDEVDLSVSVESRDASLDLAKLQNDQGVAKTLDFLKHNGVKDKDVQTDYVSVEPVYDPRDRNDYATQTKPLFYRVSKGIGIKLTDVSSFDGVLTGLIANGVNNVQGIDFRTSDLRKYKDQARAMAIRAAKEKADAMASELGVKVGKPYNISVNDAGGWNNWSPNRWSGGSFGGGGGGGFQNATQNAAGAAGENGPTFAAGQISVSASVNVSFLIQ